VGEASQLIREIKETVGKLGKEYPKLAGPFDTLLRHTLEKGALSTKEKELIALSLGVLAECRWCIALHTKAALDAGATKDEIVEACFMAVLMGGGPALAHMRIAMETLEEFSKT